MKRTARRSSGDKVGNLKIVRDVPQLPQRARDAHKGDFGRVLVIGGSAGMIGAPALCANAALRSGAGLVRVAVEAELIPAVLSLAPCATAITGVKSGRGDARSDSAALVAAAIAADVLAIGPGWSVGPARQSALRGILSKANGPAVIDADGLNNLARIRGFEALLQRRSDSDGPAVLTPHPGEMQRLLDAVGIEGSAVRQRELCAVALARQTGATIVLKGAGTIVTDGARVFVNTTGNPGMATGGSGDVLTGLIAALIGQRMTPFDAAVLGVHVHGLAGDLAAERLGQVSLIATDLIDELPAALRWVQRAAADRGGRRRK